MFFGNVASYKTHAVPHHRRQYFSSRKKVCPPLPPKGFLRADWRVENRNYIRRYGHCPMLCFYSEIRYKVVFLNQRTDEPSHVLSL
jgi:hypothetical protein